MNRHLLQRIGTASRRMAPWLLLTLVTGILAACASTTPRTDDAVRAPSSLRVADDGRHLVYEDGTPFFWLGDTAWELFHRLDREEADRYLADRARKGFTVIQAVALAELDGLETPNPYGEVPLIDNDPAQPNDAYFQHVDYIVDQAAAQGLYIGLLPSWGDKWNKKWGVGPVVFTPENAQAYGRFLGARYADRDNIIWILGGDRNPETDEHLAIIRAMAAGIEAGDGGAHLMTYHPQGGSKSYQWFHDDAWLDFNMYQSGHQHPDAPNYTFTTEGYGLAPVTPVLDGEPRYEDHPIGWDPENGWFMAFDTRQAAYWSMLAGAFGHTYGNHNIWQMWQPGHEPISSARTPWSEALAHPGAAQVGFMRRLFTSRPFLSLVPDQTLLVGAPGQGAEHVQAARDAEGRYLYAYTPYGRPLSVDLSKLTGAQARAWWFDPRTGVATEIGLVPGEGTATFDPPGAEERGNDWVLVVDDAAQGFPAPGTRTP